MKHLYLLRHAKSSWDDDAIADFDRPLNQRGLTAAPFMGELMARRAMSPELIISSPAKRAMQTAILVQGSSGLHGPMRYDERIYEASIQTLRSVVSQISDAISSVLIVGHNPGMEGIIRYLTGDLIPMPTAALAVITLSVESWAEITADRGVLTEVYRPKDEMIRDGRGD